MSTAKLFKRNIKQQNNNKHTFKNKRNTKITKQKQQDKFRNKTTQSKKLQTH